MKFILSVIGVTIYAGLVAIIAYAITPTESATRESATAFIITVISCGVLVYLHPGPIVTDVP